MSFEALHRHQRQLENCSRCDDMRGPVIVGTPVLSPVLLIGQAPGSKEGQMGKPFAWTAGRTLFKWFRQIGLDEVRFRQRVYMAAVCRCFPGKAGGGGDRVPNAREIANCSHWLDREFDLLKPTLIIPVGKLAIAQLMAVDTLAEVIGRKHEFKRKDFSAEIIPLPHPSGASAWHKTPPGNHLLQAALSLIAAHPAWRTIR